MTNKNSNPFKNEDIIKDEENKDEEIQVSDTEAKAEDTQDTDCVRNMRQAC